VAHRRSKYTEILAFSGGPVHLLATGGVELLAIEEN
jgi:hypothetical protein